MLNIKTPIAVTILVIAICGVPLESLAASGTPNVPVTGLKLRFIKWILNDQKFVEKAVEDGHAEIEFSKLALQKSNTPQIREFAQEMLDDHSKVSLELKGIAQGKNLTIPLELDLDHKEDLGNLQEADADEFDAKYLAIMQKDHEKTVSLFAAAAESKKIGQSLQGFAKKTLPVVQLHLQHVYSLRGDFSKKDGVSKKNVSAVVMFTHLTV